MAQLLFLDLTLHLSSTKTVWVSMLRALFPLGNVFSLHHVTLGCAAGGGAGDRSLSGCWWVPMGAVGASGWWVSPQSVPFHMVLSKSPVGLILPITIMGTVHPNASRSE